MRTATAQDPFAYQSQALLESLDLADRIRDEAARNATNIIVVDFHIERMRKLRYDATRLGFREDADEISNLIAHASTLAAPYREGLRRAMLSGLRLVQRSVSC